MSQFQLTSRPLPKTEADLLATILDEAFSPRADAVSYNCTSEEEDLWCVEAYYSTEPTCEELDALTGPFDLDPQGFTIKPLETRNWVAESLKGLAPVETGRFFIHGSHDRGKRKQTRINIEIDAGTAFGTGHHATTAGCLVALDTIAAKRPVKNILDVGCGAGILAIAAAKLLKKPVIASDIDPEAVRVCAHNARTNAASPLVRQYTASGVRHPAIRSAAPFDLVFANILARPLIALAPEIAPLVSKGGFAVLSGLKTDQERQVIAAWNAEGLVVRTRIHIEDWSCLILTHPGPRPHKKTARRADDAGQLMIAQWLGRRFRG